MRAEKKRKEEKTDFELSIEKGWELGHKKREIRALEQKFIEYLKDASLVDAVGFWITELRTNGRYNPETIENYRRYLEDLFSRGILPMKNLSGKPFCVGELHFNRKGILQVLIQDKSLSDNEKRYRLNALVAFTRFLEVETSGFFHKFECPQELILSTTNRTIAPKVLTFSEYGALRKALWQMNERDGLIVDMVYYTARALVDVLSLTLEQVEGGNKAIFFEDAKDSSIPVKINAKLSSNLAQYIQSTKNQRQSTNYLFITNNGKKIFRTRITQMLQQASKKADLGFIASIKMVQKSYIAEYRKFDESEENIMKAFNLKNL